MGTLSTAPCSVLFLGFCPHATSSHPVSRQPGNGEEVEGGGIRGLFLDRAAKGEERRGKVNNRLPCMISYKKVSKCPEGLLAKVIWKVGLKQAKAIPFYRLKEISRSESKPPVMEAGRISKTRSRAIS